MEELHEANKRGEVFTLGSVVFSGFDQITLHSIPDIDITIACLHGETIMGNSEAGKETK